MGGKQRIWILTINEPLFYGPMYAKIISLSNKHIQGIILVPGLLDSSLIKNINEIIFRIHFYGIRGSMHLLFRWIKQKFRLTPNIIREAKAKKMPIFILNNMEEAIKKLSQVKATHVLATLTEKVKEHELSTIPCGWINTHCGLLPRYAGVDAPFWALKENEPLLGVTLHYMASEFDSGPIIIQRTIANNRDSYFKMLDKLFQLAVEMHESLLYGGIADANKLHEQNITERTYYSAPTIDDSKCFIKKGGRFI